MIKYVLDKKNFSFMLEPTGNANKPWEIICFGDGDYAGDPVNRRSITDFILYVLGVPVSWQSKAQKSVTFSSSEADQVALSEDVMEVMFVIQLLGIMKISVKLSVMVRVDNVGTIFMATNILTTSFTKHVDIRYKYVNKYVEDEIVNFIFAKSAKNDSNILTKNLSAEHMRSTQRKW